MLPQPLHLPAMHVPPAGPPGGQLSISARQLPVPAPTQQPPPLHIRLAQQASPGVPQPWHSPSMQASAPVQVLPGAAVLSVAAAGLALAAVAGQVRVRTSGRRSRAHWPRRTWCTCRRRQLRPAPVQTEPWQQGWFSTWPQPLQTPALQVPPLPPPWELQAIAAATQRGVGVVPAAQQPPALHVRAVPQQGCAGIATRHGHHVRRRSHVHRCRSVHAVRRSGGVGRAGGAAGGAASADRATAPPVPPCHARHRCPPWPCRRCHP